jgi:hypothetical protein
MQLPLPHAPVASSLGTSSDGRTPHGHAHPELEGVIESVAEGGKIEEYSKLLLIALNSLTE